MASMSCSPYACVKSANMEIFAAKRVGREREADRPGNRPCRQNHQSVRDEVLGRPNLAGRVGCPLILLVGVI